MNEANTNRLDQAFLESAAVALSWTRFRTSWEADPGTRAATARAS